MRRSTPLLIIALAALSSGCNPLSSDTQSTVGPGFYPGLPSIAIASAQWNVAPSSTYAASNLVAMAPFSVAIEDASGEIITSDSSSTVTLSLASGDGSLGGTLTRTASGGIATFDDISYTLSDTIVLLATENTSGHSVSQTVTVSPGATSRFVFSSLPSHPLTGSSFGFMLTTTDAYNNVTPAFSGTVNISSDDASATLPSPHTFVPTDSGIYLFTGMAFNLNGSHVITASSGGVTGSSPAISVVCSPGKQVLVYTGAAQAFTPPSYCTSMQVKLWGAGGGGGTGDPSSSVNAYPGGGGGAVNALVSMSPAQTYTVVVGGGGASAGATTATGGFGGGGNGNSPATFGAGGGGGRSAIQLNGTELITAAGGGGAGSSSTSTDRSGGAGGGVSGLAGGTADGVSGGAGTQNAGGIAGSGASGNGTAGSPFLGGGGSTSGGGGGGGGYLSGGGGGATASSLGAGGGGSSYLGGAGVSAASTHAGSGSTPGSNGDSDNQGAGTGGAPNQSGTNGRVVISWGVSATSVNPPTGDPAGSTSLQIFGWGFGASTQVTIGGSPCTGVIIASESEIDCTTPAGTAGTSADVVVTVPGYPAFTLSGGYTYQSSGFHGNQTFTYTGSDQTFTPPAGVSAINVKMWGAGGGAATALQGGTNAGAGGGGGYVSALIAMSPAQTYTIVVGGAGATGPAAETYGGGGAGFGTTYGAASGGGRSAIQLNGVDLLAAGGGGGGGISTSGMRNGGPGGGENGLIGLFDSDSAGGGSQLAGGVAGQGMSPGNAGSLSAGGDGNTGGGSGGGGGYFGGGGGGNDTNVQSGAGGGGSSLWTGTSVSFGLSQPGSGSTPGNSGDAENSGSGLGGTSVQSPSSGLIYLSW